MYLIYWKGVVSRAVARLCDFQGIVYEIKDDSDNISDFSMYEAIIPSPGIPGTHKIYQTGKIIAELDFAFQFLGKNTEIIAITGTDWKSTTTHIIYSILEKYYFGKKKVYISWNFEIPFSQTVLDILQSPESENIIVVEISSFMGYAIGKTHLAPFSPDYTIWTNLKSDHLNWHRNLQEYFDAKANLVRYTKKISALNTEISDFLENNSIKNTLSVYEDKIIWFSYSASEDNKYRTDSEKIILKNFWDFSLSKTGFSGLHNAMNWLSVAIILEKIWLRYEDIKNFIGEISWLPHRLENLWKKWKVLVIEDSKSTSSQSLAAALGSFGAEKNLLLIVGWSDKWDSFEHLSDQIAKRVKKMACIGATKEKFIEIARKNNIEYIATDSLSAAVQWLYSQSDEGDILMLSPGCASFGLFTDYLDRANQFREAVKKI